MILTMKDGFGFMVCISSSFLVSQFRASFPSSSGFAKWFCSQRMFEFLCSCCFLAVPSFKATWRQRWCVVKNLVLFCYKTSFVSPPRVACTYLHPHTQTNSVKNLKDGDDGFELYTSTFKGNTHTYTQW